MKVKSFQTEKLQTPFKFSYEHNLAKRLYSDIVILKVTFVDGVSCYSEAAPRSYVTGENSEQTIQTINTYLTKTVERFDGRLESVKLSLDSIPDEFPNIRTLFESILLDYICQKNSYSLFNVFSIIKDKELTYTAPITSGNDDIFKKMVEFFSQNKMKRIKVKITNSHQLNIDRIKYIQKAFGPDVSIRMDGNEIWSFDDCLKQVPELIDLGVHCFEQLFSRNDLESYKRAYENWGNDCEFIVDESITTVASLESILKLDYIQGCNLKISKNGGILQSLDFANKLQAAGKSVRIGCHVGENSLLSLSGIILASLFENFKDIEGSIGDYLLEQDFFNPSIKFGHGGRLNVDSKFRQLKLIGSIL